MLNFNIDGNLDCKIMCQKIDRYIQKVIQEKGQGKYILNNFSTSTAIINLGGIANICYSHKNELIAFTYLS